MDTEFNSEIENVEDVDFLIWEDDDDDNDIIEFEPDFEV